MNLQVGDIVRYLNDVGGGVVQRIIDTNKVEIEDESGFAIPVLEKELVLVEHPQKKANEKSKTAQIVAPQVTEEFEEYEDEEIEGNENPHIFLAFVRNKKDSKLFQAYLINDCNYHIFFVLSMSKDDTSVRLASGLLEANTKIEAMQISYDDISNIENIHLQGILFKKGEFIAQKMIETDIAIHPVKFYKPGVFTINDFFDEDAYVIDAYDAEKLKIEEQKEELRTIEPEKIEQAIQEKKEAPKIHQTKKIEEPTRVIDLHIGEIMDDYSHLERSEILEIQMRKFEEELAKAINDKIDKIVFIHGVGAGILKAKIRGTLDRDYPQYFYQDASYQDFKFGATLVYFHKQYK